MPTPTLKKLARHCDAAADILVSSIVRTAADTLADPTADPRDSLAVMVDAERLYGIATWARQILKEARS